MTTMVYVACAEPREIVRFAMDRDSGVLRQVDTTYVPGIEQPASTSMPLAVSPDKRVLHAALRGVPYPGVSFAIAPHGGLSVLGGANLPHQICYLTVDRTGRHIFAASYQGALLASFKLNARGAMSAPPTQVVPTPPACHSVIQDASGCCVYAASLGGDVVMRFRFDVATGLLSDMQTADMPKGAGPRHLKLSKDGRVLYALCELDATIGVFDVAAETGLLTRRQILRTQPEGAHTKAADLHLTPDGRFLYASERGASTLTACAVAADGSLSVIGAFETETVPRGFAIDPRGRFLLAVGQESQQLSVYRIDTDGRLGVRTRYPTARNPNWVEIVDLPTD
ncbi:MAG TPA: beta-propeller fold lactonase family protein [Acetobacteraceae bacterium]|jgi:6-phosphogluconolactonase|nr:beta-propeller fold lactonase family protein [Acetobacteraceae bacterium]